MKNMNKQKTEYSTLKEVSATVLVLAKTEAKTEIWFWFRFKNDVQSDISCLLNLQNMKVVIPFLRLSLIVLGSKTFFIHYNLLF